MAAYCPGAQPTLRFVAQLPVSCAPNDALPPAPCDPLVPTPERIRDRMVARCRRLADRGTVIQPSSDLEQDACRLSSASSFRSRWVRCSIVAISRPRRAIALGIDVLGVFMVDYDRRRDRSIEAEEPNVPPPAYVLGESLRRHAQFSCEGKTRCSQMNSCDEAEFHPDHCPGVEIYGDHAGIPCGGPLCGR